MTRPTIDELEIMTPSELWELLIYEVYKNSSNFQFIQDLITCGCPLDIRDLKGRTPLHWAVIFGHFHLEVAKLLVSKGADIHIRDEYGNTAWDCASNKTRKAIPGLEPK